MKLRRSLPATVVPVALSLACAGTALAASPKVTVRVEGAKKTLLSTRTVTAPRAGSITTGGAPAGTWPADTAAGALDVATHGHWGGTYDSGLGVEVLDILGVDAAYAHGSYWEFFVDDRAASEGICDTSLHAGEQLLFAQVPAKGTEYPLVVSAPRKVTVGEPFTVRTFYFTGKSRATRGVSSARYGVRGGGRVRFAAPMTSVAGTRRVTASKAGTLTLSATATGEIRSAPVTVKVVR